MSSMDIRTLLYDVAFSTTLGSESVKLECRRETEGWKPFVYFGNFHSHVSRKGLAAFWKGAAQDFDRVLFLPDGTWRLALVRNFSLVQRTFAPQTKNGPSQMDEPEQT